MTSRALCRLKREASVKMDQVEKLLELYKQTQAPSERSVLLETVRINSPDGLSRLEERILKEQVRGMTLKELVRLIAAHRDLPIEQAEELLRDTIFQNLLDRAKLNPLVPIITQVASHSAEIVRNDRGVHVVILKDPKQGEEIPSPGGEISQPKQNDIASVPPKPVTPLPQLPPRGIGG